MVGLQRCTPAYGTAFAQHAGRSGLHTTGDHRQLLCAVIAVFMRLVRTGCANLTPRQQRALSGGAIGAAGGAAGGAIVGGSPAVGAALGGAVGAATGAHIT
jgi:osmotically inducible lipoprotein OsmB